MAIEMSSLQYLSFLSLKYFEISVHNCHQMLLWHWKLNASIDIFASKDPLTDITF